MMNKMNGIKAWLKWGALAGVFYCCLCFFAILMAVQGGVFPEPWDPPPSALTAAVSATGRNALIVLTWPIASVKQYLPGKALPGVDYLYLFITGFAVGSIAFCGWKLRDQERTETNQALHATSEPAPGAASSERED